MPERIAAHLGMRLFRAPFILEGGSFFVDGEGTLITTEQCLLNSNRNPSMRRVEIEQGLKDYLGVTRVVWLPVGHSLDVGPEGTDGHVDGIAQYLAPGHVLLEAPADPAASEYEGGQENMTSLLASRDAKDREFHISVLDVGGPATVAYANHYIANGGVIVPTDGSATDGPVLEFLSTLYPGREVVGVPGETLAFGGGGPHCITQQIPVGEPAPA
jgi:agmatine deiminase